MSFHTRYQKAVLMNKVIEISDTGFQQEALQQVKEIELIIVKENSYLQTQNIEAYKEQFRAFTYERGFLPIANENEPKQVILAGSRLYSIVGVDERDRQTVLRLKLTTQ